LIYEMGGDLLGTLGRIHNAIETAELRLAFICGASFGPRTEDLLTLKWSDFDLAGERPVVRYVAEKTGTFHVVPLAPFLVDRLKAGRIDERWLFPNLISHQADNAAKSRACRRTVSQFRDAVTSTGFDFTAGGRGKGEQKPFQVLRATCNERFERHHRRAGEWILGHAMNSLNRKSYQNPGTEIFHAVVSLPQPTVFLNQ
jgi:integrase